MTTTVTCGICGRRARIKADGNLSAHNDGTHGPHDAPRQCSGTGTDRYTKRTER